MAIYLNQITFADSPLYSIGEAVLLIPTDSPLVVRNNSLKIIYFFEGKTELSVDDGAVSTILPGDSIIVSGNCVQSYRPLEERRPYLHALIFKFLPHSYPRELPPTAKLLQEYLHETFNKDALISTRHSVALWEVLTRLRHEFEARQPSYEKVIHHLAAEFLFHLAELAGLQPARYLWQPELPINRGFSILFEQLDRNAGSALPHLPLALSSSPEIDKAAHHLLGFCSATLYQKMQMEAAKLQLLITTHSITRIAQRTGFQSLATFYRQFRKFTGVSPGNFKKQHLTVSRNRLSEEGLPILTPDAQHCWSLHSLSRNRSLSPESPGLLILLKGGASLQIGGQTIDLAYGSGLVLSSTPRIEILKAEAPSLLVHIQLEFPPCRVAPPVLLPALPPAKVIFLESTLQQRKLTLHHQLALHFSLSALKAIAVREQGKKIEKAPSDSHTFSSLPLAHVREYILKNYQRNIKLSDVAWAVGLSEEHLARQFQATYKETVMNFLKRHRLTRAKFYLQHTNLPLEQIALQAGFTTTSLFFRSFKAQEGCTPGTFRRQHQKRN